MEGEVPPNWTKAITHTIPVYIRKLNQINKIKEGLINYCKHGKIYGQIIIKRRKKTAKKKISKEHNRFTMTKGCKSHF